MRAVLRRTHFYYSWGAKRQTPFLTVISPAGRLGPFSGSFSASAWEDGACFPALLCSLFGLGTWRHLLLELGCVSTCPTHVARLQGGRRLAFSGCCRPGPGIHPGEGELFFFFFFFFPGAEAVFGLGCRAVSVSRVRVCNFPHAARRHSGARVELCLPDIFRYPLYLPAFLGLHARHPTLWLDLCCRRF